MGAIPEGRGNKMRPLTELGINLQTGTYLEIENKIRTESNLHTGGDLFFRDHHPFPDFSPGPVSISFA